MFVSACARTSVWCFLSVFCVGVCAFVSACTHVFVCVCGCVWVYTVYMDVCARGTSGPLFGLDIHVGGAGKAFGHLQQFLLLCNHHLIAIVAKHYSGIQLWKYVVERYTKESESAERRALSSEIERWRCGALRQQQASYSVFWPRKQSWSFSVQACFDPGNSRILSISYLTMFRCHLWHSFEIVFLGLLLEVLVNHVWGSIWNNRGFPD